MDEINNLIEKSKIILDGIPAEHKLCSQVVILKTSKGNLYNIAGNPTTDIKEMTDALIEMLEKNNDTMIDYILCRWTNEQVDMPPIYMRRIFLNLNTYNKSSKVVVCAKTMTGKAFAIKNLELCF